MLVTDKTVSTSWGSHEDEISYYIQCSPTGPGAQLIVLLLSSLVKEFEGYNLTSHSS